MYQAFRNTLHTAGLVALLSLVFLVGCSAVGGVIKRGDQAMEAGNTYVAANAYLDALDLKPGNAKAMAKLSACSESAYEQKLKLAEGYQDQGSLEDALAEYEALHGFIQKLRRYNVLNFVPIDTKEAIRNVSAGAAEKHYTRAEDLFNSKDYTQAIEEYKAALALTRPYKEANAKIAESYYQLAEAATYASRYRSAAKTYQKALEAVRGYKDASVLAASLYYHLGNYFLQEGYCRNAYDDFDRVREIMPQYEDVRAKIAEAETCATVNIAFVTFDNTTGRNLAGMDLGDFIFEEIKTLTRAQASQFIRMMDREQLSVLLQEQQISEGLLLSESTIPTNLTGVDYLIFGKINQVLVTRDGLSESTFETTYSYQHEVAYVDKKGKRRTRYEWADAKAYFKKYKDAISAKLAGAIRVVNSQTGELVINHQIAEQAGDAIEYLGEYRARHDLNASNVSLADEVTRLRNAPSKLEDIDTLTKRMIDAISGTLSAQILSSLDRTPRISDPTTLAGAEQLNN